jgi:hypothetical protein
MESLMEEHLHALRGAAIRWMDPPDYRIESWLADLAETQRTTQALALGIGHEAFTDEWLRSRVSRFSTALNGTEQMLIEGGLMASLNSQYSLMASGLRADDWTRVEVELLRSRGVIVTRRDLEALVFRVREAERLGRRTTTPSQAFAETKQAISEAEADLGGNLSAAGEYAAQQVGLPPGAWTGVPPERRKPRIFKAFGKLVTGVALVLADIGAAAGAVRGLAPAEVTAGTAMTSVVTGVGALLEGVGEFRAE